MVIKLIVDPNEGITTFVTETIIESLTKAGMCVQVLSKELFSHKDVELLVVEKVEGGGERRVLP
jgi:hypothetical protein